MKQFFTIGTIFMIIGLFLTSCSDDSKDPFTEGDILPMSVGNTWEYLAYDIDYSTDTSGTAVNFDTTKNVITDKKTVQYNGTNYEVYEFTTLDANSNEPYSTAWYKNKESDGIWIYGKNSSGEEVIYPYLSKKFPADKGDSWYTYSISNDSTGTSYASDSSLTDCTNNDIHVSFPSGTFRCIIYHEILHVGNVKYFENYVGPDFYKKHKNMFELKTIWDVYLYYSPGYGYIGLVIHDENDRIIYKKYLVDSDLN